jgi:CHASE3 domain sensor protein
VAKGEGRRDVRSPGLTLPQRIQLLVGGYLAVLVIVGWVAAVSLAERDAAVRDLERRVEPAREHVNELFAAMVDQQNGLRGFLLTRDRMALTPFVEGERTARQAQDALDRLLGADPRHAARLEILHEALTAWRRETAEPTLALLRAEAFDEALARAAESGDRERFAAVRDALGSVRLGVVGERAEADARAAAARGRLTSVIVAALVAAAAMTVASAVALRRWITRPFAAISDAVARVRDGDLHHRVAVTGGPTDLAALADDVDAMRARTVGLLDEATRAREALEQQGTAVVTLRAELAPTGAALPDPVVFAGTLHPAEGMLAGDWYDCLDLGDGRVLLCVVDVSGHGPEAGIFALRAKHLLQVAVRVTASPGEALCWLADHIGDTGETFLTCLLVEVDAVAGVGRYASAGHPPGLLLVDGEIRQLEPTGPLLGPLPGWWGTQTVVLAPGALLMACTDGLLEARGAQGQFGLRRVVHALTAPEVAGPADAVAAVMRAVTDHTGRQFADDVTLVALALEAAEVAEASGRGGWGRWSTTGG